MHIAATPCTATSLTSKRLVSFTMRLKQWLREQSGPGLMNRTSVSSLLCFHRLTLLGIIRKSVRAGGIPDEPRPTATPLVRNPTGFQRTPLERELARVASYGRIGAMLIALAERQAHAPGRNGPLSPCMTPRSHCGFSSLRTRLYCASGLMPRSPPQAESWSATAKPRTTRSRTSPPSSPM